MEAPAAEQPHINLLHVAALAAAAVAVQPALAAIAAAAAPAVLAVVSNRAVQLGAAAGLAAALATAKLGTPAADNERSRLQAELDRNAALDGAPQAKRAEASRCLQAESFGFACHFKLFAWQAAKAPCQAYLPHLTFVLSRCRPRRPLYRVPLPPTPSPPLICRWWPRAGGCASGAAACWLTWYALATLA